MWERLRQRFDRLRLGHRRRPARYGPPADPTPLMAPDVARLIAESLGLRDAGAAARACSPWRAAIGSVLSERLAFDWVKTPLQQGTGTSPNQLNGPQHVATLPGGAVAIADSGNHRVQIRVPMVKPMHPVVARVGDAAGDCPARPYFEWHSIGRCGKGERELRGPAGVAFQPEAEGGPGGVLYVADSDNCRLHRIVFDGSSSTPWTPTDWLTSGSYGIAA